MGLADLDISLIGPTVSVPPPRWPLFQLPWTLSARGSRRDARDGILLSSTVPCTVTSTSPRCFGRQNAVGMRIKKWIRRDAGSLVTSTPKRVHIVQPTPGGCWPARKIRRRGQGERSRASLSGPIDDTPDSLVDSIYLAQTMADSEGGSDGIPPPRVASTNATCIHNGLDPAALGM